MIAFCILWEIEKQRKRKMATSASSVCSWLNGIESSSCSQQILEEIKEEKYRHPEKILPEIISSILQRHGKFQLFFVAAHENKACMADVLVVALKIHTDTKTVTCEIKTQSLNPLVASETERCSPDIPFHVVLLEMLIYEETKGKPLEIRNLHTALLLVDNKSKEFEFYEPEGSKPIQEACGPLVREWVAKRYPDYRFLPGGEMCPVGLQSVGRGGTCWLWTLFYFYGRVRCDKKQLKLDLNRLVLLGPNVLNSVLFKFGCHILSLVHSKHLDIAQEALSWYDTETQSHLQKFKDQKTWKEFQKERFVIQYLYLTGRVREELKTILGSYFMRYAKDQEKRSYFLSWVDRLKEGPKVVQRKFARKRKRISARML